MHPFLLEAYHQFSNDLAIVNLPMPLDSKCNWILQRTLPPHTNACALARLGLTVWRANPKAARQFDEFMFGSVQAPLPAAAEQYARQLVGSENFDRASTKAWVNEQVRQDIAIYDAVYWQYHKGLMPQVVIGTNLISGPFNREQLFGMLFEQFGLKAH